MISAFFEFEFNRLSRLELLLEKTDVVGEPYTKTANDFSFSITFVNESFLVMSLLVFFLFRLSLATFLVVKSSLLFLFSTPTNSFFEKLLSTVSFEFASDVKSLFFLKFD